MGLDMFLFRRKKNEEHLNEEEVCYWRKVYHIRDWFIAHLEDMDGNSDGDYFEVTKEILEQLVKDCKTVLEYKNVNVFDIFTMPTEGSLLSFYKTDYDECDKWYFDHLENTVVNVTKIIETTDWETEVVEYCDCW